jgi:hypothetical protein
VIERFGTAGIPKERVSFVRDTYTFEYPGVPSGLLATFRQYYGPTMNAFEAAERSGRAADLLKELEALFEAQNKSPDRSTTSIPATFLRITVARVNLLDRGGIDGRSCACWPGEDPTETAAAPQRDRRGPCIRHARRSGHGVPRSRVPRTPANPPLRARGAGTDRAPWNSS